MTTILRIEHEVADFDRWRVAFDSDPVGRDRGGVSGYRVMRAADDPNYVLIDLEFQALEAARTFLTNLRRLWNQVDVMQDPQARIVDLVEEQSSAAPSQPKKE